MALRIRDAQPVTASPGDSASSRPPIGLIGGVVFLVAMVVLVSWLLMRDPNAGDQAADQSVESDRSIPAGLEQGEASTDYDLATKDLHGVPRGFPQTVTGAVEASSAMYEVLRLVAADRPQDERDELLAELLPAEALTPEIETVLAQRAREMFNLDDDGRPLDGRPGDRFINECLPEYGLYRVTGVTPETGSPELVEIDLWMPCVEGTGSSDHIDDLRIDWRVTDGGLTEWRDGDWRAALPASTPAEQSPIKPAEDLRPNVSVAERAALVASRGDGWMLYDGWSEDWPTELLGEEPR